MKLSTTSQNPRTVELFAIMAAHGLSIEQVAATLDRTVQTVWSWRTPSSGRTIPKDALALLRLKYPDAKAA